MNSSGIREFRLVAALGVALGLSGAAWAQASTGWIGAGDGKDVLHDKMTVGNGTGKDANDFHAIISVRDDSTYIQAANGWTSEGTIAGSLAPGPKPKSLKLDIDNINVAAGGNLTFGWDLDLNHRNERWVTWWWTQNGALIDKVREGQGQEVNGPQAGGNGGGGVGGGGGAGGQGGGGGSGFFIHPFTIYNLEAKEAVLSEFYVFASMTDYSDLSAIPWQLIDPVDLGPTGTKTIGAQSTFTFDFETIGSYTGGHVYYRYKLVDDFTEVIGDHPVEDPVSVPEPAATSLIAVALGLGLAACRVLTRGRV